MNIVSKGLKVFLLSIVVCIISFFVVVSFNTIKIGLFSEDLGYDVRGIKEGSEEVDELFRYYIKDDIDLLAEEYEAKGYKLTKKPIMSVVEEGSKDKPFEMGYEVFGTKNDNDEPVSLYKYYNQQGAEIVAKDFEKQGYEIRKYSFRSEVEKGAEVALSVISQLVCLFILISFIYNELWKLGNKDFEAIRLYGTPVNKLKGLYVGLVAIIPAFVFLTFALITKNSIMAELPIALFTFSNCYAYEILFSATNGAMFWADVQVWQAVIYYSVLIFIPVISLVSYIIGAKDISISEKLIYKNNKHKRRV